MEIDIIKQLLDLVKNTIKSVNPYQTEHLKISLSEYENPDYEFLMNSLDYLAQGDILSNVPFLYVMEDGNGVKKFRSDAIILSNTCDCQRKNILIAPLIEWDEKTDICLTNKYYPLMYIPEKKLQKKVIRFSMTNALSLNLLKLEMKNENISKLYSLTQIGFYFFYLKLSIYLMRPEDVETTKDR